MSSLINSNGWDSYPQRSSQTTLSPQLLGSEKCIFSIPLYSFHRQWIYSISFSLESFLPSDFRSFLVFLLSPLIFPSFLYLSPSSMSFCSPWISLPKTICLIDMLNNILMSFNVSLCIRFKNKTIFKNFIIKKKYFQLV